MIAIFMNLNITEGNMLIMGILEDFLIKRISISV